MLHSLLHGRFQSCRALSLGALLGLETLLHGLEVLPKGTGKGLEGFLRLLLEGFLPLGKEFFRLCSQLALDKFQLAGEGFLLEFPEYEPYFLIEVDRINNTDTFDIQVEVKPEFYTDQVNELVRLRQRLTSRIQSVVGIQPAIKIVQPGTIERSTGKAKRAIDHRKFE